MRPATDGREIDISRKPGAHDGFLHRNGLTIAFIGIALASLVGQALSGWHAEIAELRMHGERLVTLAEFLAGGRFLSALFENWESEFLQMGLFVLLTVWLRLACTRSRGHHPKLIASVPRTGPG